MKTARLIFPLSALLEKSTYFFGPLLEANFNFSAHGSENLFFIVFSVTSKIDRYACSIKK